ncbi:MAG: phosphonopyruvate decarboxylase [Nanoarchaeota archaeon]|nr:phosphonopyruvate decarboxylase [Nanoarchaeota archaeon]
MISPRYFFDQLKGHDLTFYAGVPDSLLKDFCAYVTDNTSAKDHIIAANEGNAIALAAGYHLATGKAGVVYLQNSGLGNCVNPLTSLTDKEIYSLPLLLLIGWRAEPGRKDEPQHRKMGRITLSLLEVLEIPYAVLPENEEEAKAAVQKAAEHLNNHKTPYALVVREGTFDSYSLKTKQETHFPLVREEAIKLVASLLDKDDIIVSTTGKTSRELFEFRKATGKGHHQDFLTVGSMGHSSAIAVGIALQKQNRKVYCFDGDGALIMHMGILSTVGKLQPVNFNHIVFNNFAHDSVGGQPTAADAIDILEIAKGNGYKAVFRAETAEEIKGVLLKMKQETGPMLLEIRCNKGARKNLGRPTQSPLENKKQFMEFLQKESS